MPVGFLSVKVIACALIYLLLLSGVCPKKTVAPNFTDMKNKTDRSGFEIRQYSKQAAAMTNHTALAPAHPQSSGVWGGNTCHVPSSCRKKKSPTEPSGRCASTRT
jgi:hypothetical protein